MRITLAPIHVERDLARNLDAMVSIIGRATADDWLVFPEGALTGYFPEDPAYLSGADPAAIEAGIMQLGDAVRRARVYCLFGTARRDDGDWHNAVVVQSHDAPEWVYRKRGLSRLDQRHFAAGGPLETCERGCVTFGVQVCRELLLPAAWSELKARGAQVIFHINNAIKPRDRIWEHVLIARALENGLFVCSVNNAAPPQSLGSVLIDPSGGPRIRIAPQHAQVRSAEINPGDAIARLEARTDF
jgi:predicted amidohydrolase